MKWPYRESQNLREWHDWLAWHPVHVGSDWVWLEVVSRRLVIYRVSTEWEYEHRT